MVRAAGSIPAALSASPSPALPLPWLSAQLLQADLPVGLQGPPARSQSQAVRAARVRHRAAPELAPARAQPALPRAQVSKDRAAPAPPEHQLARAAAGVGDAAVRRARDLRSDADPPPPHRAANDREAVALHHLV